MKESIEKFTMANVMRSELKGAEYNPRTISEDARKKLRKSLKEFGLVQPLIVNSRTMNIVGGHQRLEVMDKLGGADYPLTVAMVDVSEQDEVKLNVLLNNNSVMGQWDKGKLFDIKQMFDDIDFEADLGFDKIDIEVMFGSFSGFEVKKAELDDDMKSAEPTEEEKEAQHLAQMRKNEAWLESKKKMRENMRKTGDENNDSFEVEKDDYTIFVVFNTTVEKKAFMKKIGKKESERHIKASVLFDLEKGVFSNVTY